MFRTAPLCLGAPRRSSFLASFLAILGVLASSCTPPPAPLELPEGCNPLLAGADCMLPYPSDFFLVDDPAMKSGKRVQMSGAGELRTAAGLSADINQLIPADGYSRQPTIAAVLGGAILDKGFAHITSPMSASTSSSSLTLVLDAETGTAIPHLADLDARATDPLRQALLLRPLVQLEELHRYIVVVKDVLGTNEAPLPAPEGYRRLRDDVVGEDPVLAPLMKHYRDAVFPVLEKAGIDRARTQLVWDFTTGADAWAMDDMLRARELALAELDRSPPVVQLFNFIEDDGAGQWLRILGSITGPRVLADDGEPGSLLARDAEGRVALNGTTTFEFIAIVPPSVRDSFAPGVAVAYGHGFFGGRGEIQNSIIPVNLDEAGAVGFAVDWVGMAAEDVGDVVRGVGSIVSESLRFGERVPQAMVNWITLTRALQGPLQDAALADGRKIFRRPSSPGVPGVVEALDAPGTTNAGALLYDPAQIHYFGISQGHILGGTLAALNPDIKHIALQCGGASYTYMMSRATPFKQYLALLDYSIGDPLDEQKLIASFQRGFDRFDPATYAPFVLGRELPSGPSNHPEDKRVLMQIGVGDAQVPNFSAYFHARALGIPLVEPSARPVEGLEGAAAPVEGSGLVVVDLGQDDSFYEIARPADENNPVHEGVRRTPEIQQQLGIFLRTGRIENTCGASGCVVDR